MEERCTNALAKSDNSYYIQSVMEPFYIMRRIRALADSKNIQLSPTELMEILRILLCPAEREYDYENDESLLKLIRRIKQGGGVIHYPLINPANAGTWTTTASCGGLFEQ